VVITMGCHLRYLNHSLFKCFVYYTRLPLGLPRLVRKHLIAFHCVRTHDAFSRDKQLSSFQTAPGLDSLIQEPRLQAVSRTTRSILPGVLPNTHQATSKLGLSAKCSNCASLMFCSMPVTAVLDLFL
jgi:hypothetical protein